MSEPDTSQPVTYRVTLTLEASLQDIPPGAVLNPTVARALRHLVAGMRRHPALLDHVAHTEALLRLDDLLSHQNLLRRTAGVDELTARALLTMLFSTPTSLYPAAFEGHETAAFEAITTALRIAVTSVTLTRTPATTRRRRRRLRRRR